MVEVHDSLSLVQQEVNRHFETRFTTISTLSRLPIVGIGNTSEEETRRASGIYAIRAIMRPYIFEEIPVWNKKVALKVADYLLTNYKDGVILWLGDTGRIDNFPPRERSLEIQAIWKERLSGS